MNSRWKNFGLWAAVVALVPIAVEALADYNVFIVLPKNFDVLVKAIFTVLILAGIINNPSAGTGYKDSLPEEKPNDQPNDETDSAK